MQGLWKENISGWNYKDSKRKKQSRKHTLKDKFIGLYKNKENSSYRKEGEAEYVNKFYREQKNIREFWKVEISRYCREVVVNDILTTIWSIDTRTLYLLNGCWYDPITHQRIGYESFTFKRIYFFYKIEDESTFIEVNKPYGFYGDEKAKPFVYGKPVFYEYQYLRKKSSKSCSRYAHRSNRRIRNVQIKKEDFDSIHEKVIYNRWLWRR